MRRRKATWAMAALIALGCSPTPAPTRRPPATLPTAAGAVPPSPDEPASRPTREAPAAVRGVSWYDLPVAGHRPAVVVTPRDTARRYPVLVAAHGAGDRAEWQCAFWSELIGERGVLLCPRGVPMTRSPNTGWFFRHHHALEREVLDALDALFESFPQADDGPVVFAGYSQGAIMGALFAAKRPERFPRLILIEGGFDEWDVPTATAFGAGGGKRVLLACGIAHCLRGARRSLGWLRRAEVPSRIEHVPGGGHTYGGSVGKKVAEALGWALEGDPRWVLP